MEVTKLALLLLALFVVAKADYLNVASGTHFGYDDRETSLTGPSLWGTLPYSKICAEGQRQSPVDIPSPSPVSRTNGPVTIAYKPTLVHISNDGHTFVINARNRYLEHSVLFVQNLVYAPLGYRLFQGHFHWGRNDTSGSEHAINGRHYPLELHLVHYNSRFGSIDAAVRSNEPDALIVVGILFEVGPTTPPSLSKILQQIDYFRGVQQEIDIEEYINLSDMYPWRLEYFTYLGSFTTPRCNESNRWLVLARTVSITREDLDKIRSVNINLSRTRTGPGSNARPLQPLYDRQVTCSFSTLPSRPSAPAPPPQATPTPAPTPEPAPEEQQQQ